MVMQRSKHLFRCGLILFLLAARADDVSAQPKFLPSQQYPGPWLEVTAEVRDLLALHQVSACNQAAGRQSSRNSGEYLLYCTQDGRYWTSWRVQPLAHKVRGPGKLLEGIPPPDAY